MNVITKARCELPRARARTGVQIALAGGLTATCHTFDDLIDGRNDHLSLSFGSPGRACPLVRVHSECLTGDVFHSMRCDCGAQIEEAIRRCGKEGGIILYLRQEGRGIGLAEKIAAYALQDQGLDTFAANRALGHADDERDFSVAAQMLLALGVRQIRLLSNNPDKMFQLRRHGIAVADMEATIISETDHNRTYLGAKRDQAGHRLVLASGGAAGGRAAGGRAAGDGAAGDGAAGGGHFP